MQEIMEGFIRFQHEVFPQQIALFKRLSTAQSPNTLFVTCPDIYGYYSRVAKQGSGKASRGNMQ